MGTLRKTVVRKELIYSQVFKTDEYLLRILRTGIDLFCYIFLVGIGLVHILTLEKKVLSIWVMFIKYSFDMELVIPEHYKHCKLK